MKLEEIVGVTLWVLLFSMFILAIGEDHQWDILPDFPMDKSIQVGIPIFMFDCSCGI